MKKRMLSIILTICMVLMLVPTTVFAESDIILGDVNCDGNINTRDLIMLRQYLCDISGAEISNTVLKNSDINRDGNINVFDYTLLYNRILELIGLDGVEAGTPQTNIPPKTISSSAGSDDSIKVKATSNYFPSASTIIDEDGEYVTVTYFIDSDMDMVDLQWSLIYDPAFLKFDESDNKKDDNVTINLMPFIDKSFYWNIVNGEIENKIKAIASTANNEKRDNFAGKGLVPFVTATFKIIGSGETEVHLYIECLTLSDSENKAVNSGAVNAETSHPARMTAVYKGNYDITGDSTKPVISYLENNKTYCDTVEFEVTDNVGVASVQAGNEILTPGTNGKYTLKKGKGNVKVIATDFAGNTADVTVTVNNGHTAKNDDGDCSTPVYCIYHPNEIAVEAKSHDFDGTWEKDDTGHWHKCQNPGCNQTDTKINHSGTDDGNCKTAVICECGATVKPAETTHNWGSWTQNVGEDTHTRICKNAGCNGKETEPCTGGIATCIKKAVCDTCKTGYGEKNSNNHTGSMVWTTTETQHKQYWNCCNAVVVAYEDHTWNNGVCSICDYTCSHKDESPKDHVCDYGCTVKVGEHTDTNKDHACDYGCSVKIGTCEDKNYDHKCDHGCGKTFGVHAPAENKHTCGYCGVKMTDCKDDNKDHLCDICKTKLSEHSGGMATCKRKAVCDYCKKEYGELDLSNHDLENIPAKESSVTDTGNTEYWHCKDCENNFSDADGKNSIPLEDTVIAKLPPAIIEGMEQSITAGDKKALTFRSNAAFGDFIRVELDGKTLDKKNYTSKEGSTVVTLNADYVAKLSTGKHTIGIVSESGTATTTFTVNEKAWKNTVLRLQSSASKTSVKLKWNAVPGADGYMIYWNKCGAKSAFKPIKTIKSGKTLTWTHKKLKKNSWNRYMVKAYRVIDGEKSFIKTSNQIHLATKGGKYTNVKKLKSSVSSITLKNGKTKALKITQTYAEKYKKLVPHMRPLTYTTTDKNVATVTSKGVIKAKGKGSCYIYITAFSGVYTRIKVTVK